MFGLVLTFVACIGVQQPASATSLRCRTIELPFDGSLNQCIIFGQHQLALWVRDHEGWLPARGWRCEAGKAI